MAVDHSKCWEQTPALSSTPKVPNVTVTMSEEAHSYAWHEGAQSHQARKGQESVAAWAPGGVPSQRSAREHPPSHAL